MSAHCSTQPVSLKAIVPVSKNKQWHRRRWEGVWPKAEGLPPLVSPASGGGSTCSARPTRASLLACSVICPLFSRSVRPLAPLAVSCREHHGASQSRWGWSAGDILINQAHESTAANDARARRGPRRQAPSNTPVSSRLLWEVPEGCDCSRVIEAECGRGECAMFPILARPCWRRAVPAPPSFKHGLGHPCKAGWCLG